MKVLTVMRNPLTEMWFIKYRIGGRYTMMTEDGKDILWFETKKKAEEFARRWESGKGYTGFPDDPKERFRKQHSRPQRTRKPPLIL